MATLGARVDEDFFNSVAQAAAAQGMKVSGFLIEALKDKLGSGPKVNTRQLNLLSSADKKRLVVQQDQVRKLMMDGAWRSLPDIAAALGLSEASIPSVSARLRDLRKPQNGGYTVDKRQPAKGYFEYQVSGGERGEG